LVGEVHHKLKEGGRGRRRRTREVLLYLYGIFEDG
jgi:hypothetical protein